MEPLQIGRENRSEADPVLHALRLGPDRFEGTEFIERGLGQVDGCTLNHNERWFGGCVASTRLFYWGGTNAKQKITDGDSCSHRGPCWLGNCV